MNIQEIRKILSDINEVSIEAVGGFLLIGENCVEIDNDHGATICTRNCYSMYNPCHKSEKNYINHSLEFYFDDYSSFEDLITNLCKILIEEWKITCANLYDPEEDKEELDESIGWAEEKFQKYLK